MLFMALSCFCSACACLLTLPLMSSSSDDMLTSPYPMPIEGRKDTQLGALLPYASDMAVAMPSVAVIESVWPSRRSPHRVWPSLPPQLPVVDESGEAKLLIAPKEP